ncbi:MAG: hypothetical protein EOS81_31245 [Mesorhizobium sp.]|uniref:hypothetical protein n=2 Tax=Mesorhizobium TaxID=68287 RepID=UPI000FD33E08|nr:hypothetical protein [Mesorhizobium sp.]RUY00139.1 hypothetical protein EOA25_24935 [Mesorhizobium sp. M2A.F.Ca.ET.040.01.1.1]RWE83712.1 MAG: hypothetical protein EOS81_31245 [Mesorhizobium sp.]RWF36724.1 MAG: hypothetical protein EOS44_03415 [Mesorhizobium sp.]
MSASVWDSYMDVPSATLAAQAYPDVPITRPLDGNAAFIDTSAAKAALGFEPRFSWRDYR